MSICINPKCQSEFIPLTGSKGKYCSLSCGTVHRNELGRQSRVDAYEHSPALCKCCRQKIPYLKRTNKFCSNNCAASYNNKDRVDNGWQHPAKKTRPQKEVARKPRAQSVHGIKVIVTATCPECLNVFLISPPSSTRKYCSPACRKPHWGGFRSKSQITKKIHYYEGCSFDSGAEVYFVQQCNKHNITWKRNSGEWKYPYVDTDGKSRNYYPDFLLPQFDTFVEIKGKRFLNASTYIKLKAVDKPIELVMSTDINLFIMRVCASMPVV